MVLASFNRRSWNSRVPDIQVAVKVFKHISSGISYEDVCQEAYKEAGFITSSYRRLQDECIIRVYGVVEGVVPSSIAKVMSLPAGVNRCVGVVMAYAKGGSLSSLLHPALGITPIPLSTRTKLRLIRCLIRCITELHAIGLIHADIKPENILLTDLDPEKAQVIITDFGISKFREASLSSTMCATTKTLANHTVGTPIYCAVEMFPDPDNDDADAPRQGSSRKTDIYAFALVCWQILTRERPYADCANNFVRLVTKLYRGVRPDLSKLPPDVPPDIQYVMESCWERDRSKRLTALDCFSRIDQMYMRMVDSSWDVFLSYNWAIKPVVLYIHRLLFSAGYKVWLDDTDMKNQMDASMVSGVHNSTVFVSCCNSVYQTRPNCIFELQEAMKARKPIIPLVTEDDPISWANTDMVSVVDFRTQMYCLLYDTSDVQISSYPEWCTDDGPSDAKLTSLRAKVCDLIAMLLNEGCHPSMPPQNPEELEDEDASAMTPAI